jgi:glycosyltransferase involved in cell wall biosynthesis
MTTNVLHLITRFLRGGAEQTTTNTLRALQSADRQYDLHLGFGDAYDSDQVEKIESIGIPTVSFRTLRQFNPVTQIGAVGEIAWSLFRNKIDILHTHSTEAGIVGRCAAAIAGVPVVIHEIHGDPVNDNYSLPFNILLTLLERSVAPFSTKIVVKSEQIRDTYLRRRIGTADQYELIYHGVDIDHYRRANPATTPPKRRQARLLFVGRLARDKGLFDLLSSVDRLTNSHSLELLIVGDGLLKDELQAEVKQRNLAEEVSFLGYRNDVAQLLQSSDIFVLPSYREGTPRAITEALAAGVPVVSTDIAGIPEQVTHGENGYLVSPGDIDSLTERLAMLISDQEHRADFASRTTLDLKKFNKINVQGSYQNLYADLVETHLE